jgi:hypothetical protein
LPMWKLPDGWMPEKTRLRVVTTRCSLCRMPARYGWRF